MTRLPAIAVATLASVLALASCDGEGADGDADADGDGQGRYEAEIQLCVDRVNEYREVVEEPRLERMAGLEACAAEGAEQDAWADAPGSHFARSDGCGGVASAVAAGYAPIGSNGPRTVAGAVETLLDHMIEAGAGDSSHDAIVGPYESIGCGVFVTPESVVWLDVTFD